MHFDEADTVLVRYDEIGVKSRQVRLSMEKTLCSNVRNILDDRGIDATVDRAWSRIRITPEDARVRQALDAATDTFGVASASPCVTVEPDRKTILETLDELAARYYNGGSFAVRVHRAGGEDEHDFSSPALEEAAGTLIEESIETFEPEVDLDDPDITFSVEARRNNAYIFLDEDEGPGGLPLGTQQPLVALISGGHDSPVAAWEMMRRGCEIVPIYLDLGDYGGVDHVARAYDTVKTLQRYAPDRDLRVRRVPVGEYVDRMVDEIGETRMLSYRRFMYRIAERLCEWEDAAGIVTGESIGQKSSQTAANLQAVDTAISTPIHRPLLTWDKQDIVATARTIGTFEGSKIAAGCPEIAPSYPETAATADQVGANEPDDLLAWADEAADDMRIEEV